MNFGRFDQGTGRRILSSADERGWMSSYFIHKCNSLHQIFRIIVKINSFNTLLSLLLCMFWNTPLSRGTASREGERRLLSHRHELLGWKHTHHVVILKKNKNKTNMGHVMIQHCCCCCFFFIFSCLSGVRHLFVWRVPVHSQCCSAVADDSDGLGQPEKMTAAHWQTHWTDEGSLWKIL